MASKYTQKTAVSFYKFDNEADYHTWLAANHPSDAQDIVAIIKDENMNNGLDLFINGHSLTKTKIYIKKGESVTEVTDSNNVFDPNKQYVILNVSRRGLGQKNIVVLEEVDIQDSISQKFQNFADNELPSKMEDYLGGYLDEYMEDYFTKHPVQTEFFDAKKLEGILTNTHYMFRKIFSLLYKERAIHLGLSVKFLDEEKNVIAPFTEYKEHKTVKYLQLRISGMIGKDVTLNRLELFRNDSEESFMRIDGPRLVSGNNPDIPVNIPIDENTTIHAVLYYTMNRIVDTARTNNLTNFDSPVFFKKKDEHTCCCSKFYITEPEIRLPNESLTFNYQQETQTISVFANNPWNISIPEECTWCHTEIQDDDNNPDLHSVSITVDANPLTINRSVILTFNIEGGESKTMTIHQNKVGTSLNVSPTSLSFEHTGGTKSLTVSSNYSWEVTDNANWIELEIQDNKVNVIVSNNTSNSKRSATVSFTSNSTKKDVTVTQNGAPVVKVFDKAYIFFVPTEYDEDGYTKLKAPYDTIQNLETVSWFTSNNSNDIENEVFDIEYNKTLNLEFPFSVPSGTEENYQLYLLIPLRDINLPAVLDDTNTPIKLSASNFDDSITEKCDVGQFNSLEYVLFKQGFAQGAGQTFTFKITTK